MRKEIVKSMKLAGYLMQHGFKLYEIQKDNNNSGFDVYVFRGSDEISSAIQEYLKSKNRSKDGNNIKFCDVESKF